jgi:hypothetical protein
MELKDPQVKCRTLKHDTCDIDLSGWEITCTKFIPRGRRQTSSTTNTNTEQELARLSEKRWTMPVAPHLRKSSISMPVRTSLSNKQPGHPSNTNRCFNCGSSSLFARECPQPRQPKQGQGSSQNNKNKGKRQTVQVHQGRINLTTLADLPEGAPMMSVDWSKNLLQD